MVWPLTAASAASNEGATTSPKDELLIFAHFPGITGTVTEKGYEGWVQLTYLQWGAGLGISSGRWNSDEDDEEAEQELDENVYPDRKVSQPSISELVITKPSGPESIHILHNTLSKKAWDIVTLVLLTRSTTSPKSALTRTSAYYLYSTLVSGFSSSSGGSRYNRDSSTSNSIISETISLNFLGQEFLQYDYGTGDKANAEVTVTSLHYHLTTGTTTLKKGLGKKGHLEDVVMDIMSVKKEMKTKKKKAAVVKETDDNKNEGEGEAKVAEGSA